MNQIDWLRTIRVAVFVLVCLGLYLWLASQIGRYLELSRQRDECAERIRKARLDHLNRLVTVAEEIQEAPEHEQVRLYREAQALGFCDQYEPPRAA